MYVCLFVCLQCFAQRPSYKFSIISGLDITCAFRGVGLHVSAQGNNTAEVGIEPPTSRSGVRDSTTWLSRSQDHSTNLIKYRNEFIRQQ